MSDPTLPVPAGLLHDFGDDWQIERVIDGQFLAIERKQPPVLRFQLADSAEELRALLEHDREIRGLPPTEPRPSGWESGPRPTDQGSK